MTILCQLDHIVIAASSLDQGVNWFKQRTGILMPSGGFHPLMGTHNHLMQIGNNAFLEIIAIDPDAPAPQRPRWYGLDDPLVRRSLQQPRLLTWVANTTSLDQLLQNTRIYHGDALKVTRGDLSWRLTVPQDGSMPNGGLLPSLIQWNPPGTPCAGMSDLECRLTGLTVSHPYPEWYRLHLTNAGCDGLVTVKQSEDHTARLTMELSTPAGPVTFNSL